MGRVVQLVQRFRWSGKTAGTLVAVILIATVVLTWIFWTELTEEMGELSTTLRNIGILSGGAIAIVLTIWRSSTSERQTDISQQQVTIAQESLLNQRYERGAEMLGSETLTVRIGGIYALANLANEQPERYHIPCIESICAFVRYAPATVLNPVVRVAADDPAQRPQLRGDIEAAMKAISERSEPGIVIEREKQFQPDLSNADLRGLILPGANLERVILTGAKLDHAQLQDAKLQYADLRSATLTHAYLPSADLNPAILSGSDLSDAKAKSTDMSGSTLDNAMRNTVLDFAKLIGCHLNGVDMTGASLDWTNLSNAIIAAATGLRQDQLNSACIYPDEPPTIRDNVLDSMTNQPLVWISVRTLPKPSEMSESSHTCQLIADTCE